MTGYFDLLADAVKWTGAIIAVLTVIYIFWRIRGQLKQSYRLLLKTIYRDPAAGEEIRAASPFQKWRAAYRTTAFFLRFLAAFKLRRVSKFLRFVRIYAEQRICAEDHKKRKIAFLSGAQEDDPDSAPMIEIETCDKLYAKQDDIKAYFAALAEIMPGGAGGDFEQKFICRIHIKKGFVAPLHFLAGSLHQFENDWNKIIDEYSAEVEAQGAHPALISDAVKRAWNKVLPIRTFLFDCWLLWGPSIPICNPVPAGEQEVCAEWKGSHIVLQYGFGDENNSVELYADAVKLRGVFGDLTGWKSRPAPGQKPRPLAYEAEVFGTLCHSKFLRAQIETRSKGKTSRVGAANSIVRALDTSWDNEEDRLILDISNIGVGNGSSVQSGNSGNNYYSGYLWSMFVILAPSGPADEFRPVQDRESWKNLMPFFVHGNLADGGTYDFLKRQLAGSAVSGLMRIVADFCAQDPSKEFPLRFAYGCAFDDANCGPPPAFPHCYGEHDSIRAYLEEEIERSRLLYPELDPAKYILIKHYNNVSAFAACSLPGHLAGYYRSAAERRAQAD